MLLLLLLQHLQGTLLELCDFWHLMSDICDTALQQCLKSRSDWNHLKVRLIEADHWRVDNGTIAMQDEIRAHVVRAGHKAFYVDVAVEWLDAVYPVEVAEITYIP